MAICHKKITQMSSLKIKLLVPTRKKKKVAMILVWKNKSSMTTIQVNLFSSHSKFTKTTGFPLTVS